MTKELTPYKAVLIYSMALVLVVLFELPRVLSWFEETRWKLASGQMYDGFGANLPKLVSRASDPAGGTDQFREDPSGQADPKGIKVAQLAVCEPPLAPGADQMVVLPDSSGNDVESPVPQSAWQTNGDETSAPGTASPKLKPHKVLLVGDSMIAEGFGPALQRELIRHSSVQVIRKGRYSTGFAHQEDFNWASALRELTQKNKPDLIVIHMGTNDPIDMLDESGKRLCFGNDKWNEVYASRVREFLKCASEKKILSFWVGLPIMSSHKYCAKISLINSIVQSECAKVSGCVYVDSWPALADSKGNYSAFINTPGGRQTRIRAKDNVHLTEAGGEILSEYFLLTACRYVDLSADDQGAVPR